MSNGVSLAKKELRLLYPLIIVSVILAFTAYIIWISTGDSHEAVINFFRNMNVESIRSFVASFGIWAPLIFISLQISQEVVAPMPGVVFMIVGGIMFGTFYGVLLSILGGTIGAFLCFLLAKKYGRPLVQMAIHKKDFGLIDDLFEQKGIWMVAILRAVPIIPFGFASYFISMTNVNMKDYIIGSIIGSIPMTIIWTHMGSYFLNNTRTLLITGIIMMVIFILVPWATYYIIDTLKKNKSKNSVKNN